MERSELIEDGAVSRRPTGRGREGVGAPDRHLERESETPDDAKVKHAYRLSTGEWQNAETGIAPLGSVALCGHVKKRHRRLVPSLVDDPSCCVVCRDLYLAVERWR